MIMQTDKQTQTQTYKFLSILFPFLFSMYFYILDFNWDIGLYFKNSFYIFAFIEDMYLIYNLWG